MARGAHTAQGEPLAAFTQSFPLSHEDPPLDLRADDLVRNDLHLWVAHSLSAQAARRHETGRVRDGPLFLGMSD